MQSLYRLKILRKAAKKGFLDGVTCMETVFSSDDEESVKMALRALNRAGIEPQNVKSIRKVETNRGLLKRGNKRVLHHALTGKKIRKFRPSSFGVSLDEAKSSSGKG